ncbi:FAD-dependent oxidoreductase [Streptomyces thinghirensis]|nr:FAD-dependent oxidoreductase [Streptomyces thinghirensis]
MPPAARWRRAAVGDRADGVRTDAETPYATPAASPPPDLLRMRTGDTAGTPAAVVLPDSHDGVLAVLEASRRAMAWLLVPFGGGTSVVGVPSLPGRDGTFVAPPTCAA